jgi:hypothetical protein
MRAGAEAPEPVLANMVQDAFGEDAARRIAGAQEQDIPLLVSH